MAYLLHNWWIFPHGNEPANNSHYPQYGPINSVIEPIETSKKRKIYMRRVVKRPHENKQSEGYEPSRSKGEKLWLACQYSTCQKHFRWAGFDENWIKIPKLLQKWSKAWNRWIFSLSNNKPKMTSWMSGDQPVNFDRVEHISALSMNSVIKEMEYTKKSLTHLCPSNLKKKIKVERPVYKYRKSTKDLRCFPILCLLFSFSLSLLISFLHSLFLSFSRIYCWLVVVIGDGWSNSLPQPAQEKANKMNKRKLPLHWHFLRMLKKLTWEMAEATGRWNQSRFFPLTPSFYTIPNTTEWCSNPPPAEAGGCCWLIGLLQPSSAHQSPQPIKRRRTCWKTT